MADFYLAQGDTSSALTETLKDATGAAVNIQGAAVHFDATPIHGGAKAENATAVNLQTGDGSDGSKGKVAYGQGGSPWTTLPAAAGDYLGQFVVTFAGGAVQSYPNAGYILITVTPDAPTTAQQYCSVEELKKTLNLTGKSRG